MDYCKQWRKARIQSPKVNKVSSFKLKFELWHRVVIYLRFNAPYLIVLIFLFKSCVFNGCNELSLSQISLILLWGRRGRIIRQLFEVIFNGLGIMLPR